MKKLNRFLITTLASILFFTSYTQLSVAQSVSFTDYSVLPETVSSAPDLIPNVLIVIDNSGSMRRYAGQLPTSSTGTQFLGGHHPNSRSYIARKVMRDIISDPANLGKMNVGFMEFDMSWFKTDRTAAVDDCGDWLPPEYEEDPSGESPYLDPADQGHIKTSVIPGCDPENTGNKPGYSVWRSDAFDNGKGRLRENVSVLDEAKVERLDKVMGIEPKMPDLRCLDNGSLDTNGECLADQYPDTDANDFIADSNSDITASDGSTYDKPSDGWTSDEDYRLRTDSHQDYYKTQYYLLDETDSDNNNTPDIVEADDSVSFSTRGTPTFGSLVAAQNYLRNKFTPTNTAGDGFFSTLMPDGVSPVAPLGTSNTSIVDEKCSAKNYIILITDGAPWNNIIGKSISSQTAEVCNNPTPPADGPSVDYVCSVAGDGTGGNDKRLRHTKASIASLLAEMRAGYFSEVTIDEDSTNGYTKTLTAGYAPIETIVFGFGSDLDSTNGAEIINEMAKGGTGASEAFFATTADVLKEQISSVFENITATSGSSSGISVVASSSDTAGSVVQAIYNPNIVGEEPDPDDADETVEVSVAWTSTLSAFFVDKYGYLREDGDGDGELDDYGTDYAFELDFDTTSQEVKAQRILPSNLETVSFTETDIGAEISLNELVPIWEAGDVLSGYEQTNSVSGANIYSSINRDYDDVASETNGYRRIYSWLQSNPNSTTFDNGTQLEFIYDSSSSTSNKINDSNFTLLGVGTESEAENIVNFLRGDESIDGFRNRSIDGKAYLLGDIVHSTAAQVDTPTGPFATRFNDDSYSAFKEHYQYRRRMVYVGANDGLLHAFNGGFWDGENAAFELKASEIGCVNNCDEVEHELGAEIWAYAPMNLLPHLQFLTRTDYNSSFHVAYVDGPINVFDVRAFDADETHINGWGTILVVGMRLGGGEFGDVQYDASDTSKTFTARSAYIILDVTNPREEPKVIGEITHENLGFTTSTPTIVKEGDDWFLMFGSGPNDISTATSIGDPDDSAVIRKPTIFKYKLNEGSRGFTSDGDGDDTINTTESAFIGDMVAHDWNSDYNDDAVYFGVVSGTETTPGGALYRYVSANETGASSSVNKLLDTDQPIVYTPLLKSFAGKNWAFFGTGRYLTSLDAEATDNNSFYGVIEPRGSYGEVLLSSLANVTDVTVKDDGMFVTPLSLGGDSIKNFSGLRSKILSDANVNGWLYNFETVPPSSKNSAPPLSFKSLLFYTHYDPPVSDGDLCSNEFGISYLNVVDLVTGTASFTSNFEGPLGLDGDDNIIDSVALGDGYAYRSYLFIGPDTETGDSRILIKSPLSTGQIKDTAVTIPPSPNGRTSWRELEIQ